MFTTKFSSFALLIIFSASTSSLAITHYEESLIVKATGYRLPTNTVPRLYTINVDAHLEDAEFTFDGTSSTVFEVLEPTRSVTVHVSELIEIDKMYTKLINKDGTIFKPLTQRWNSMLEFFNLKFNHSLDIGNYTVKFKWRGHEARSLRGFYRAKDVGADGNVQYMAATHFQATAARAAFPCWDEPGLKAEFEISLKHWPNYTALSNMPVKKKVTDDDGKIWTSFERSPLMSTYLVAFVIAAYERHVNEYGNITLWVHREDYDDAKMGFDLSTKLVPAMEEYTGIPYSFPKLDQAVIPRYSSGATEHWGLISYASGILYSPKIHPLSLKDRATLLPAHEIAHLWFGNLVTPAWWSDVWLSEAFASYFQHKLIDMVVDNWHSVDLFVTEKVSYISFYAEEASRWVHPIKWVPDSPQEVRQIFTAITYKKGAAVLRMLEHIVTPHALQRGLRLYLTKHQYGTVTTDDLWAALQTAYDKERIVPHLDLKEIMDPWLEQTGYPMLNVTRDYETGYTAITQTNAADSTSLNRWMIPINFATRSQPNFALTRPSHWLQRSNESLLLYDDVNKNDWIILNVQQTGFYRVNYDDENWKRIAEYLNSEYYRNIHVLNRAQLLRDIFYLTQKESRYYEIVVDLMAYLHRETSYLPWMSVGQEIRHFSDMLIHTKSYEAFTRIMLYLMSNFISHIGTEIHENTDHLNALAIAEFLPWACAFGHQQCRDIARRKFADFISNTTERIDPNMKSWVFCYGLMAANESILIRLMRDHFANPKEEYDFLGCTENSNFMKKYLDTVLTDDPLSSNSWTSPLLDGFSSLLRGKREKVDFAVDYFIEKFDAIEEYFNRKNESDYKLSIMNMVLNSITTTHQYDKFATFLHKQSADGKLDDVDAQILRLQKHMEFSEEISETFNSIIAKKPSLVNFIHDVN